MKLLSLFGYDFAVRKAGVTTFPPAFYFPYIREPYAGAWQHNMELREPTVLAHSTVYACVTLIADDIAKMRMRLMESIDKVLTEIDSSPFLIAIDEPNNYQTTLQFFQSWMYSKLVRGNAYILKVRDGRGIVNGLDVLHPDWVIPLESPNGEVFYELRRDPLAGVQQENVTVPASEIIHDRMNCLFHRLVGVPPMYASRDLARQALRIVKYSDAFFHNAARPSGFLTAPGPITKENAERLKSQWEQNFAQGNQGRVAVAGEGLKFEAMTQNAVDSQLVEQLNLNAKAICTAYRVPSYKVGVTEPNYAGNISTQDIEYYKNTIQPHATGIESLLTKGLELPSGYVFRFDTDDLLRMDQASLIKMLSDAVDKGLLTHNEARKILNMGPQDGGEFLFAQQQMFPLAALAQRTTAPAPVGAPGTVPGGAHAADQPPQPDATAAIAEQARIALAEIHRGLNV